MKVFAGRAYGGGSIVNGAIAIQPRRSHFEETFPWIDADEMYDTYFPRAMRELKVSQIPEWTAPSISEADLLESGSNAWQD